MTDSLSIPEALAHADALARQGQLAAAESVCRQIVQAAPHYPDGWTQLGVVLLLARRLPEAENALHEALARNAQSATAWNNLSVAVRGQRRSAEAEQYARRALALDPACPTYWLSLGGALVDQQRWAEAAEAYREATERNPAEASAWAHRGACAQNLQRLDIAHTCFERALELAPGQVEVLTRLAFLCSQRGQHQRAIELARLVLERAPQLFPAWMVLGHGWRMLGDLAQAEAAFRRAVELAPQHVETRYELASVLLHRWSLPEAEALCRALVAEAPQFADAWALLGVIVQTWARPEEGIAALRRSLALAPTPLNYSKLLVAMQYSEQTEPLALKAAHEAWAAAYAAPLAPPAPLPARRTDRRPLRIGLVSSDFVRHPTGFLVLPAIEHLDRARFSVVCYSDRLGEDEYTARFRQAASLWRVTTAASDDDLAAQIRRDEIDVLFDLTGHVGQRLLLFARRPAPVQITWFGYVGTTGLKAIDFLLADGYHVRPGEEPHFVERVLRMPGDYACYGPPTSAPDVQPLPALHSGWVTFGCLSNPAKFSPGLLSAWAEILRRVPRSRLLIKFGWLGHSEVQRWLRQQMSARGIEAERILIEGDTSHDAHLAAYHRVDLALDTQPYSGGLTTCEALWMGVPVITAPGRIFASRHATSHLIHAGYPQFVSDDLPGYIDLAVQWAGRLDELAALRRDMRAQARRSRLCDAPRFAREFGELMEAACTGAVDAAAPRTPS